MRSARRFGFIPLIAVLTAVACSDSKSRPGPATPPQQGPWTITVTAGAGGTITPAGPVSVAHGGSATFVIAPDVGFAVSDVTVDGVSQGPVTTYTFANVTAAHVIAAAFVALPPASWVITATAGAGGTITPSGAVVVPDGGDQSFTVTADAGFNVADVTVDGVSQGAVTTFTFTNVTAAHTISAAFTAQPTSAVVRLQTQGTLPAGTVIGGVQVTLTYATDKGLSIAADGVVASGAGAGSLLVANTNTAGQVIVALINASGIGTGEFATATFQVAAPNVPVGADFAVAAGATVIDLNGQPIPGITVAIAPPDIS
jgi:hypothetical protein